MTPLDLAERIEKMRPSEPHEDDFDCVLTVAEARLVAAALRLAERYSDMDAPFDLWTAELTIAKHAFRAAREEASR